MPRNKTASLLLPLLVYTSIPLLPAARAGAADKPENPPKKSAEAEKGKLLFDGKSLAGWKRTEFAGGGNVTVDKAFRGGAPAVVVEAGATLSGFNWAGKAPQTNYELSLDAMKIKGTDFLCGLTFPVGESHASFIVGGWGGSVVGVSSIDGMDASENSTTKYMGFKNDRWYHIRVRVSPKKIEAWIDDKQMVDADIAGKKISLRVGDISLSVPIGISTFQTDAAFRDIRLRELPASGG